MDMLDRLGIAKDTILVFTSDHGLCVGQHGCWGHGAATFPSNLHHAAHSVPRLIRYKSVIAADQRSAVTVSIMDVFSTILDYTGQSNDQGEKAMASRSLKPLLSGNPRDWGNNAICSEQEETRVVRTRKRACFKRFADAPNHPIGDELFDVEADPQEKTNLASDPAYAEIYALMNDMLTAFFENHTRPEADLWAGGAPLQNSERREFWRAPRGDGWQPVYRYGDG